MRMLSEVQVSILGVHSPRLGYILGCTLPILGVHSPRLGYP